MNKKSILSPEAAQRLTGHIVQSMFGHAEKFGVSKQIANVAIAASIEAAIATVRELGPLIAAQDERIKALEEHLTKPSEDR